MSRTILHVDLDAFFCSVEILINPSLAGRAFVVGGSPEGRGVVSSASYPARKYGIRSAMPTAQALRLCPNLIVVHSRHGEYGKRSAELMAFLRESAPIVQQISIDEAFLDVTGDARPGAEIARDLQREIQRRFGLPTSWGVASNKLVAKIATEVGKPEGLIVVPSGKEAEFLESLPAEMLPGVGPKTRASLQEIGVRTIGDLAAIPEARLVDLFGARGKYLATSAVGRDDRPVREAREAKSISAETTFSRDVASETELRRTFLVLSERVGRRLRRDGLAGGTVRVKVRWPDFTTLTRQTSLEQNTDQDAEIFQIAWSLFGRVWKPGRKVRLIGVGVADLAPPVRQLELFDRAWQQEARLLRAMDSIRGKFGSAALCRGSSLTQEDSADFVDDQEQGPG
jgi:DNA polymerase-4